MHKINNEIEALARLSIDNFSSVLSNKRSNKRCFWGLSLFFLIRFLFSFSFVYISKLKNNRVIIDATKKSNIKIRFKGSEHNLLHIERGFSGKLTINCSGSNNLIVIGKGAKISNLSMNITQSNSLIIIGKNVSIGRGSKINVTDNKGEASFIIGDDCMISSNVEIRTYDSHPIYDLSDKIINTGNNHVVIGRNVWVGQDAKILKGIKIGAGSIIGTASVVSRSIDKRSIAAGNPVRVIREGGFYWAREDNDKSRKLAKEAYQRI